MIFYEIFYEESYSYQDLIYSPDSANANSSDETTRIVSSAKISKAVNEASKLTITVPPFHPLYSKINSYQGALVVYETVNDHERKAIFNGKITSVGQDYRMNKKVTAVGGLGWLQHSVYSRGMNRWPYVYLHNKNVIPEGDKDRDEWNVAYFNTGKFIKNEPVISMANKVLRLHNWQMRKNTDENIGQYQDDSDERFPGTMKIVLCEARENPYGVDVKKTDETQAEGVYISRSQDNIIKTYDWFQNELVEKCDANIVVDEGTNKVYIYGETLPIDDDQIIRIEENILDFSRNTNYTDVPTVFLPIGKSNNSTGIVYAAAGSEGTVQVQADPDNPIMIVATIADGANEGDDLSDKNNLVDPNPEVYAIDLTTDESLKGNMPTIEFNEDGSAKNLDKNIKVIKKDQGAVIATSDQFPGGITFTLEPPFIVWKEGVERLGRIVKTKEWSSATRSQLRAYGPSWFKRLILSSDEVEIKILDKGFYDPSVGSSIKLGHRYRVVSEYHQVDDYIPCMEQEIDLLSPSNSTYTFKRVRKGFTRIVRDLSNRISTVESNTPARPTRTAVNSFNGSRPVALSEDDTK